MAFAIVCLVWLLAVTRCEKYLTVKEEISLSPRLEVRKMIDNDLHFMMGENITVSYS